MLKRYTIRGSLITQSGSASEFYEANLRERRSEDGKGCLYKVIGMGTKGDGLGYRYIMQPDEKGGDNGLYFQGWPLHNVDKGLPHPNFFDYVYQFNTCSDEGGIKFPNGKKPLAFMDKVFQISNIKENATVLDYFAGSGTTGHAVIDYNKTNKDGKIKYVLIEMGAYFEEKTKRRILNVSYSSDWKDGKPVSRKGVSQCFKYIRLEQYEDSLNNLRLNNSFMEADNESYMLRYMLDTETRDSLLGTKDFVRPFDYTIKTTRDNELIDTPVDLVDTFNYLIGLHVDSIHWHKDDNICVVEGMSHIEGDHVLVIWRNQDVIKNDDLNEFFRKQDYSTLDHEFDVIYVNGDNTLPNLKSDEEHWKVRLIEQEMMKRMFEED